MYTDFENFSTFKPAPRQAAAVTAMLDDLVGWGQALPCRCSSPLRLFQFSVPLDGRRMAVWTCEQVSLKQLATGLSQRVALRRRLDAFCDNLHAEVLA